MKNTRKKYYILMLALTLAIAFTFYGCSNSQNKLVGRWEKIEGYGILDSLEFFSDGTYTSNQPNYEGAYSIEGDRIKLSGILMEAMVYTFEIKNNTLNLIKDNGDVASFERVD